MIQSERYQKYLTLPIQRAQKREKMTWPNLNNAVYETASYESEMYLITWIKVKVFFKR